jgi:hypothetical protein
VVERLRLEAVLDCQVRAAEDPGTVAELGDEMSSERVASGSERVYTTSRTCASRCSCAVAMSPPSTTVDGFRHARVPAGRGRAPSRRPWPPRSRPCRRRTARRHPAPGCNRCRPRRPRLSDGGCARKPRRDRARS